MKTPKNMTDMPGNKADDKVNAPMGKAAVLSLYLFFVAVAFVLNGCASEVSKTDAQLTEHNDKVQLTMDMHEEAFSGPAASRHK